MTRLDEPSTWCVVESDFGLFAVGGNTKAVTRVLLPNELVVPPMASYHSVVVDEAADQLADFLAGKRRSFTVPMRSSGTPFQEAVWALLAQIPFGSTQTYGWVADGVGRPKGPRAVGQALGHNPIPVLRGCHRVVAATSIGGYGGNIELKRRLLELESDAHV